MSNGRGGVGLRLFVTGNAEAKRDFDEFRDSGKRAFSEIGAGAAQANPFVLALSRGVGEAKEKVAGLAEETGSAGRVLSAFGVAGVAAAAAIGGLMVAVEGARGLMEMGDAIADSAAKVGVSTDTLQEYRFAIHETGGAAEDADTALKAFTTTLGLAASGLSPKAAKGFKALGFDSADLQRMKTDVDGALKDVTDRIAGLGTEAEKAAVADKLGLEPLLPLLRNGSEEVAKLRQEAHDLGYVMDKDVVASMGEANDKFEAAAHIVKTQFAQSFVELVPILLQVMQQIADLARQTNDFFDGFRKLEERQKQSVVDRRGDLLANMTRTAMYHLNLDAKGHMIPSAQAAYDRDKAEYDALGAELQRRAQEEIPKIEAKVGTSLIPPAAKAKKEKKPKGPQVTPIEEMTSIDPETGNFNKVRTAKDWAFHDTMGYFPGEPPKAKAKIDANIDVKTLDDALKPWLDETRRNLTDTFSGGIQAAFSGNLLGWMKQKLIGSLTEGLATSLADAFMKSTGGAFGGGVGGFIFNTVSSIFGGGSRHALGGPVYPGQFSSVAEYGDELALFGKAGQVYSHDETVRMLQQVAGGGASSSPNVAVTYAPSYQVQGSGPELNALRAEMQRDRDTFHGRVVGAVNDGINRRQIKA